MKDLTLLIRWASGLALIAAVAALAAADPIGARTLWDHQSGVALLATLPFFLLTFRPIFRWVHRLTLASLWLFPLLDGEWTGEISSNWAQIETMMAAACGESAPFNVLTDPLPEGVAPTTIPLTATIESGLLTFRISLRISPTRESKTLFVRPEWKRPDSPRLYYLYEQAEHGHVPVTDSRRHLGAGAIEYDPSSDTLSGQYWTARQGERGLNTGGAIRLWRSP